MVDLPSSESRTRRWHRFIEHYTPDGTVGRLLLAFGTGTLGILSYVLTSVSLYSLNLFVTLFFAPLFLALTLGTLVLTVATLWPVYLSLIGNIPSASAYSESFDGSVSTDDRDETDPVERLKRNYADGKVSESEFERRLETLLHKEESSRYGSDARELERN